MAAVSRPKPSRPQGESPDDAAGAARSKGKAALPQDSAPPRGTAQPEDAQSAASDRAASHAPAAPLRWLLLVLIAALGVAVGGLGSFGHRQSAAWLGVNWPTGLILSFAGLIGLLLGLSELPALLAAGRRWPTRLAAVGCASAGWLLALIWLTYLGPPPTLARKGDVILPNDWKSIFYLVGGMALIVVAAYRAWLASLNARLAQRPGGAGAAGGVRPRG